MFNIIANVVVTVDGNAVNTHHSACVDNFNISLAPTERGFILTNKQQKCVTAMLC